MISLFSPRRSLPFILTVWWGAFHAAAFAARELPPVPDDLPLLAQADAPERAPLVAEPVAAPPRRAVSESLAVNLINRLVARGVLTKEDSAELIKQAEAETTAA